MAKPENMFSPARYCSACDKMYCIKCGIEYDNDPKTTPVERVPKCECFNQEDRHIVLNFNALVSEVFELRKQVKEWEARLIRLERLHRKDATLEGRKGDE